MLDPAPPPASLLHAASSKQELTLHVKEHVLYPAGLDHDGRVILVFCATHLADPTILPPDLILEILLATLNTLGTNRPYIAVVVGHDAPHRPGMRWFYKAYKQLTYAHRKNLKAMYLVQPSTWMRLVLDFMRAFVNPKFYAKVHTLNRLADLPTLHGLSLAGLRLSAATPDDALDPSTYPRGASEFAAPLAVSVSTTPTALLPRTWRACASVLVACGAQVEGIFRRPPRFTDVGAAKLALDAAALDAALAGSPSTAAPFPANALSVPGDAPLVAAVLLTRWLRDLPTPIFPPDTYPSLRKIETVEPTPTDLRMCANDAGRAMTRARVRLWRTTLRDDLVPHLPARDVLAATARVLAYVARHADVTKMTPRNLTTVVAPALVRGPNPIADLAITAPEAGGVGVLVALWMAEWSACWGDVWREMGDEAVRAAVDGEAEAWRKVDEEVPVEDARGDGWWEDGGGKGMPSHSDDLGMSRLMIG
ncbi:hypothetical protein GGF31_002629 [Allomyces arbusculus]|nr:hypothetical protein GGF31_002629 [Allomyces arbusculus]